MVECTGGREGGRDGGKEREREEGREGRREGGGEEREEGGKVQCSTGRDRKPLFSTFCAFIL